MGMCVILLASAAVSFSSCLRLQRQSADLQASFELAQQVLYNEESAGTETEKQLLEYNGMQIKEVLARHGQVSCSLLQAVP